MKKEPISFNQIWFLIKREKPYYSSVIILSIFLSLISLAIPVSVQSLVNTVTFGVLLQPIIVLSLLLLFILGINVFLNALLLKTLEYFQQHFFAKMSLTLVEKILQSNIKKLNASNQNSLSHRYYDIMTVQKSLTTILSDGVFIALQLIVGMILISLYHPYFLIFDLILIVSLVLIWKLLGQAAINTAIKESYAKYAMGGWINEISRVHTLFRRHSEFALQKSAQLTNDYLMARTKHFRFLFSQVLGLLILYAVLSSFVLGVGGFLVVVGELSLGQLIAAEIIVTLILTSLTKFGKILEKTYDLVAALDKLNLFYNIETEEPAVVPSTRTALSKLHVRHHSGEIYKFNFEINSKNNYLIKSKSSMKINTFIALLKGQRTILRGQFHINDLESNSHDDSLIIKNFYLIERPEIIRGTIEENIILHESIQVSFVDDLLQKIELEESINVLEKGMLTELNSDGSPLSYKSILKLEVVRAIINKPQFVVLSSAFLVFSEREQRLIIELIKEFGIGILSLCSVSVCDQFIPIDLDQEDE